MSLELDQSDIADQATSSLAIDRAIDTSGWWGPLILLLTLSPALAAIWLTPSFTTQDGPAHLYNAQILNASFDESSPFGRFYTVKWQLLPNWAGPLTLSGLVALFPPWLADRIMASLSLVAFGASILWLRWRVAGGRGIRMAALLAALLSMNIAWLLGFTSFLLGACLFPITLGVWWATREQLDIRATIVLSGLLILGYFCHLVSLGLTTLSLLVLAVAAPLADGSGTPWQRRSTRLVRTSASFVPLIALGIYYVGLASQGGPMRPRWQTLHDPGSFSDWVDRLSWVDPLTLARKDGIPLTEQVNRWFRLLAPAVFAAAALMIWWFSRTFARTRSDSSQSVGLAIARLDPSTSRPLESPDSRQGWLTLTAFLLLAGYLGPDSLGPTHGDILPQRVVLFGLVALAPIFDVRLSGWAGRVTFTSLLVAVALQSVIVWDYALYCDRSAGQFIRARDMVGSNQRIATLLVDLRGRFRANPLIHAENWLGIDTHNIVWNNYETLHYYFPVQFRKEFRKGIERPNPAELERISLQVDEAGSDARSREWERILSTQADAIDVVVVWKSEPRLDAVTNRWFEQVDQRGDLRIYHRRKSRPPTS